MNTASATASQVIPTVDELFLRHFLCPRERRIQLARRLGEVEIAKSVCILLNRYRQIVSAGGMHVQHCRHCYRCWNLEL